MENLLISENMFLSGQNIVCENLSKIQALIGCNTTSYFYWVRKIKVFKKFLGQQDSCFL